jgi:undecaprenyl pyrophosphate phosphatase UppP
MAVDLARDLDETKEIKKRERKKRRKRKFKWIIGIAVVCLFLLRVADLKKVEKVLFWFLRSRNLQLIGTVIILRINEHSEQTRAPHTNVPKQVPRCGALS